MKRADSSVEIAKAIAANSLLSLLETRDQNALTTSAQLQRLAKNQTIYKKATQRRRFGSS